MAKTVLITGCSTGLGVALAVEAARRGNVVYATMRNLDKRGALEAAAKEAGVTLKVRALDVRDSATINAVVDEMMGSEGRVDVLINNAGSGFVRSTEQASEKEIADVIDVNQMGVIRATKAVIPHMRAARAGHVITISSVGGLVGQPFNEIYCAAKFAVEGYMESLASYVGPAFNLDFTVVEPGGIVSDFAKSALAQIEATGGILNDEYQPLLMKYINTAQSRTGDISPYQTAAQVAAVVLGAMEMDSPPVRMRTSEWGENLCRLKTAGDPDGKKMQKMVVEMFLGGV